MVGGGLAVATISNLNPSYIELELGLGYENNFQVVLLAMSLSGGIAQAGN